MSDLSKEFLFLASCIGAAALAISVPLLGGIEHMQEGDAQKLEACRVYISSREGRELLANMQAEGRARFEYTAPFEFKPESLSVLGQAWNYGEASIALNVQNSNSVVTLQEVDCVYR